MIHRRDVLCGGAAAIAVSGIAQPALAADSRRVFDLFRGRSRIGEQQIVVKRRGREVSVDIDIDIAVRILGLPAYRYQLASREIWQGGALAALSAQGNDNGKANQVTARRVSGGVEVDGSAYSGVVSGQPATTTYWAQEFLNRPVWISTQDGTPMRVRVSRAGSARIEAAGGDLAVTKFACRGDIGRLDLFYDASGEWVGSEFDARGETARFVLREKGAAMSPLWVRA
ncbi:MAG: DUF6134 family protein [Pseudomonadota bacterium]